MTTNTTNSQAASIDTPEFRSLCATYGSHWKEWRINHCADAMDELIAHIDAKLAQALNDGAIEGRIHQRGIDAARIDTAESRLAEIQRGVEGLQRYDQGWDGIERDDDGSFIDRDEVLALFAPHVQSDTSGLPG